MMKSDLPDWVVWLQALGLPVSGLVISCASVYIAWQQKRIADVRLRHELYDRRFKVYEAAKTLLVAHQESGRISRNDYMAFRRGTSDAVFLLHADVVEYLDELRRKADQLLRLSNQISELKDDISQSTMYQKLVDEAFNIETWLTQQFDFLNGHFKRAMRLD
jgi:hypothetical protein